MVKHILPALFWTILIGSMILMPGKEMPSQGFSFDKWIHGFVFFVLAYFWMVGLKKQRRHPDVNKFALEITAGICLVYGTLLEVLQVLLISGRQFEYADMTANIFGGLIGIAIFYLIFGKTVTTH